MINLQSTENIEKPKIQNNKGKKGGNKIEYEPKNENRNLIQAFYIMKDKIKIRKGETQ